MDLGPSLEPCMIEVNAVDFSRLCESKNKWVASHKFYFVSLALKLWQKLPFRAMPLRTTSEIE